MGLEPTTLYTLDQALSQLSCLELPRPNLTSHSTPDEQAYYHMYMYMYIVHCSIIHVHVHVYMCYCSCNFELKVANMNISFTDYMNVHFVYHNTCIYTCIHIIIHV